MPDLAPLSRIAPAAVEMLLDTAFGAERRGRTAYRVRAGLDWLPDLSFAAVEKDVLLGSVQCWPVALRMADGGAHPLTLLGPVAVDPAWQGAGLGKRLTRAAIAAAEANRAPPLVLIGDPDYYTRFGFDAGPTAGWSLPGPFEARRLLALVRPGEALPREGMLGPDPAASGFASARQIA